MFKRLTLAFILIFLAAPLLVMALAVTRTATYEVQRSITVSASPDQVYAAVVDFRRWERWSPWAGHDPRQRTSVTGEGLGAVYTWSGDDGAGAGRMTIVEAVPGARVGIRLEFQRPWASTGETSFLVASDGAGSRLTWLMKGTRGFMGRALSIFMDLDRLLGVDLENGLASIKADLEGRRPR